MLVSLPPCGLFVAFAGTKHCCLTAINRCGALCCPDFPRDRGLKHVFFFPYPAIDRHTIYISLANVVLWGLPIEACFLCFFPMERRKSEFAESVILQLSQKEEKRVYIATMMAFDEEAKRKIARHRQMRKEKNFFTIECFTGLKKVVLPQGCTVLLDCMSNLTANEMFQANGAKENTVTEVIEGIDSILGQCANLVVVTNEIFSDGFDYDETVYTVWDIAYRYELEGEVQHEIAESYEDDTANASRAKKRRSSNVVTAPRHR